MASCRRRWAARSELGLCFVCRRRVRRPPAGSTGPSDLAQKKGALVLWDLSHSVGSVPVHLDDCNADFAIGCTYKYLNGGPGAPGFLYVNKNIQEKLSSPIWGWWGQKNPFDFDLDYTPAPGAQRFLVGTQPMISMITM